MKNTRKYRFWLRLIQASLSAFLLYFLVQFIDWRSVQEVVRSGLIYELWPGPLFLIAGLVIAAERWRLLLDFLNISVLRSEALRMYLTGTFYGVMLPGVLGGDTVRIGLCAAKTRGAMSKILASITVERCLGLWGVSLLGTLGILALDAQMRDLLGWNVAMIAPGIAVGFPLGVLVLVLVIEGVGKERTRGNVLDPLVNFYAHFRSIPLLLLAGILLLSTIFQSAEIVVFYYFGSLLQINVPVTLYFAVVPIVYLSTVLPISLGGIGVRETALVWMLSKVGILAADAVLLAFLVYLNRIVVALMGGIVQFSTNKAKSKE